MGNFSLTLFSLYPSLPAGFVSVQPVTELSSQRWWSQQGEQLLEWSARVGVGCAKCEVSVSHLSGEVKKRGGHRGLESKSWTWIPGSYQEMDVLRAVSLDETTKQGEWMEKKRGPGIESCVLHPQEGRERERTGRGDPGSNQWGGDQEGVWYLGGKGDQLCQNGTCLVPNKGPIIRSLFWFLLIPLLGGGREQRTKTSCITMQCEESVSEMDKSRGGRNKSTSTF